MTKRIRIDYIAPPIPTNTHDWIAVDDETYGGEESDIVGYGASAVDALNDLLARLDEAKMEDSK